MMSTIQPGDLVTLYYRYPERMAILAHQRVVYMAQDVGDLWQLCEPDGTVYALNPGFVYFDKMVKETPNV